MHTSGSPLQSPGHMWLLGRYGLSAAMFPLRLASSRSAESARTKPYERCLSIRRTSGQKVPSTRTEYLPGSQPMTFRAIKIPYRSTGRTLHPVQTGRKIGANAHRHYLRYSRNLTAFQAVLADLHETAPDLILRGGDLVSGGSSPAEVVDRVRDLGWPGVFGNTDEALARPETLEDFARQSSAPPSLWDGVREMTAFTREALGEERIAWLGALPNVIIHPPFALVHASPASAWRSPFAGVTDEELRTTYLPLRQPMAIYGHIHQPFVREPNAFTVINTESVSQSFDGDPRASYLLIDNGTPKVRRVEYDIGQKIKAMTASGLPHADWVARTLLAACPQMP
jgi:Calcineurin-like phosphoesterase superfamily domain